MASRRIEDLHPDLQPLATAFMRRCQDAGVDPLITCTYRSDRSKTNCTRKGVPSPAPV